MTREPNESLAEFANRAYIEAGKSGMPGLIVYAAFLAVERETAQRIERMAMERCRLLNGDAIAQTRAGRPEMAGYTELKADQFEWMAAAISREFNLADCGAAAPSEESGEAHR